MHFIFYMCDLKTSFKMLARLQVLTVSELLEKAFKAEREVVVAIANCKEPAVSALGTLVGPVGNLIAEGAPPTPHAPRPAAAPLLSLPHPAGCSEREDGGPAHRRLQPLQGGRRGHPGPHLGGLPARQWDAHAGRARAGVLAGALLRLWVAASPLEALTGPLSSATA